MSWPHQLLTDFKTFLDFVFFPLGLSNFGWAAWFPFDKVQSTALFGRWLKSLLLRGNGLCWGRFVVLCISRSRRYYAINRWPWQTGPARLAESNTRGSQPMRIDGRSDLWNVPKWEHLSYSTNGWTESLLAILVSRFAYTLFIFGCFYRGMKRVCTLLCYRNSQKHESTLHQTYVLNESWTADHSCTTKYFWKNSYRSC